MDAAARWQREPDGEGHPDRLNSGRERAKEKGVKMGRPEGTRMSDKDLLDKYPEVVRKLRKGLSIRDVAQLCGRSVSTVQRVKKIL